MLRPTIDTLSPVAEGEDVESFHNETGRLYAHIAVGPSHSFEVYDGTIISHEIDPEDGSTGQINFAEGDLFTSGGQFEVIGILSRPQVVIMDDAELPDGLDDDGSAGWSYDAEDHRLTVRIPPGSHGVRW